MAQIDPAEVEPVEVSKDGYAIGLDLVQLESTRFGLELVGIGFGSVAILQELSVFASYSVSRVFYGLSIVATLLLAFGLLQTAPTPNGFLPRWFARLCAAVLVLAALLGVLQLVDRDGSGLASIEWGERLQVGLLSQLVLLGLPWVLWRFSQHRGLIGRAITWLWIAVAWTALFAVERWTQVLWTGALTPALGVLFAVTAHYTARDVWLDAVNRKTKKLVDARIRVAPATEAAE